jgi:hypothetical protein
VELRVIEDRHHLRHVSHTQRLEHDSLRGQRLGRRRQAHERTSTVVRGDRLADPVIMCQ